MIGIYAIRCLVNQRMYIGRSSRLEGKFSRLWEHRNLLKNGRSHNADLQRDFDQYGIEQFSFEVIEECTRMELKDLEKQYLEEFESQLYNVPRRSWNRHLSESALIRKPYSDEERQKRIDRLTANRQSPNEHSKSVTDAWKRRKGSNHRGT